MKHLSIYVFFSMTTPPNYIAIQFYLWAICNRIFVIIERLGQNIRLINTHKSINHIKISLLFELYIMNNYNYSILVSYTINIGK